ncbi:MAG: hypothetical protein K1X40_04460 [Chitinophagales bacterium]|nr:hypothetical protein [Chitinophagales bacterium]
MENKTTQALMAERIIKEFVDIIPDHLGSMELPIAKMCARKSVEIILMSNPHFTPYETIPAQGSTEWWKGVMDEVNK